jgi:Arc/MetJ-type ribon-helix-helix transcriptional regulator
MAIGTVVDMSVQMTVRIPDHLAAHVDRHVAAGHFRSRAEMISRAIAEHVRAEEIAREIAILDGVKARGESLYPDLDGLAEHAASAPLEID